MQLIKEHFVSIAFLWNVIKYAVFSLYYVFTGLDVKGLIKIKIKYTNLPFRNAHRLHQDHMDLFSYS